MSITPYYYITVGTITVKKYSYTTVTTYTVDEPMSVPCGQSENLYGTYEYVTMRSEIIDVVTNPCDLLKVQNNNPSFKANTSLKNETGFLQNADGSFIILKNNNRNQLEYPYSPTSVGFMHIHINPFDLGEYDVDGNLKTYEPIKMFSPEDVKTFIVLVNKANTNKTGLDSVYGTVVTSSGTYTLKFDGVFSDINQSLNFDEALNDKYKKSIDKYGLEKGFLKFLKSNGINGISIYKVNTDGTTSKKSLDSNNKIVTTPC